MINESIPFKQINISVITISDTRNKDTDKSGTYLVKAIKEKEASGMKMKKAAMKLKKESAMMLKKSVMEMKKASAMKLKMKKKK